MGDKTERQDEQDFQKVQYATYILRPGDLTGGAERYEEIISKICAFLEDSNVGKEAHKVVLRAMSELDLSKEEIGLIDELLIAGIERLIVGKKTPIN